jgi:hypothetical protein
MGAHGALLDLAMLSMTIHTGLRVLRAPHPSGRWLNGHPEDRGVISAALAEAVRIACE